MTILPTLTRSDLFAWAAEIDLEPTIAKLRSGERRWPRHVAREISLEYRRYLILRWSYPDIEIVPGCLLRDFDRAAQTAADLSFDGVPTPWESIDELSPSSRADVDHLYEDLFGRRVPETWFTEDLDKFLGSSQPGIVG